MKKIIVIFLIIVSIVMVYMIFIGEKENDNILFNKEYSNVPIDNIYVYRTGEEIIKILNHGTGIVYLGFPECPWCREYVFYVNEVAKANGIDKIYYMNISNDRKNNTETYKKIVSILFDYLQYDEEGNKRIYVPALIVVNKGEIIGFDDETAWDTKNYQSPFEYWQNEDLIGFKNRLSLMFSNLVDSSCISGCNE